MEYNEFKRQLGKAGLSIKAFTKLVKVNQNTITNYKCSGQVPSHWAIVAVLMGLMREQKVDFKDALDCLELTPNKVRGGAAPGRFGGSKQTDLPIG